MRKARFLSLSIIVVAGLVSLSACGGGGSRMGGGGGTPTPSSSGLNIYPMTASVPVGGLVNFTGYVPSNSTATVTWAVSGSSNGSITSAGVYTAPSSVPSPAEVAVTATSNGFSATAVVTVTSAQQLSVSPAAASVAAGSTTTFTVMSNTNLTSNVTWEVNGTQGGDGVHGTIDTNGNYIAPLTPPPGGSTIITAVVAGTSANSTVTVVYSNASFSGAYGFSYTGDNGNGYLAVAGNMTANSAGTITGTEDILQASSTGVPSIATSQSLNGTFSIGPDGRGPVTLSTGEVWQIALTSNTLNGGASQHALFVNFNQGATGSGTIDQQTPSPQLMAIDEQHCVFQLAGLDVSGNPLALAGAFTSLGSGAIAPNGNVIDINDGGSAGSNTENTVDDTTLTGSFIPSPGPPAPGALSLTSTDIGDIVGVTAGTPLLFDFYVVSPNHIHVIETDGKAFLSGDVYAEALPGNAGYTADDVLPAGGYAFTMGGATTSGAYAAGGVLNSSGGSSTTSTSGSTTAGVFDNNAPNLRSQSDATIQAGSYTADPTTGRISLASITTSAGSFALVGYAAAADPTSNIPPPVLLLEIEANVIATGTAYAQAGETTPVGSFALNLTGVGTSGASNGAEQDILGALNINGTAVGGTMDINNFEVNGQSLGLNITSGSSLDSVDSNGRGTFTLKAANGASFQLAYYDISPGVVLMIDTDSSRVATGLLLKQF